MAGGGKGGTTTTKVKLPKELEQGAKAVLAGALRSAALGYRPNRGVTTAAFSPQQLAAFQGADEAASAFGLPNTGGSPTGGYLPQPETAANGVQGYSVSDLYDQNIARSMSPEDLAKRQAILDQYWKDANMIAGQGGQVQGYPTQGQQWGEQWAMPGQYSPGGSYNGGVPNAGQAVDPMAAYGTSSTGNAGIGGGGK